MYLEHLNYFQAIGIDGSTFFLSTEVLGYRAILEAMSCCFVSGAALLWGSPKKQLQRSRDWANRLLSNPPSPKKITEVIIHDSGAGGQWLFHVDGSRTPWKNHILNGGLVQIRFYIQGFVHELAIHRGGLHGYNSERFGNEKRNGQLQPTSER